MTTIKPGIQFTTTTKRGFDCMGVNGEGVGYWNRKLVFISGALPNEKVEAIVTHIYANYIRARTVKVIKRSPFRAAPKDPFANQVGGFELENMNYPAQLRFKKALVRQALNHYQPRGFRHYRIHKTMGMQHPYRYRNKLQFPVRKINGKIQAGLFKPRSHQLVNLKTCSVQYPITMRILHQLLRIFQRLNYPIYNEAQKAGILKTIIIRAALNTPDVQIVLVTNTAKLIHKRQILTAIALQIPKVVSVMQNVNPGNTPLIWGNKTIPLAGQTFITEKLNNLSFRLSARAFLQLNSYMTPQLYEIVKRALNLKHVNNLLDAYSGVGTMGLPLAKRVKSLRGIDIIPEAIEDANANARLNHATNARYYAGKAEDLLPRWLKTGWRPDGVIVDPPRVGLDSHFIKALLKAAPSQFVYVSCNPATLAKDLVQLTQRYQVNWLQPIDMMPQTARCEVVVSFTKR